MSLYQNQNYVLCGIDISKTSFDYCFLDQNQQILGRNHLLMDRSSFEKLYDISQDFVNKKVVFFMESTSTYHRNLQYYLMEMGYDVYVIQPLLIKNFNSSFDLRKTKTDKKDAYIIAAFGLFNIDRLHTLSPDYDALHKLFRLYLHFKKTLTALKNKLKGEIDFCFPELSNEVNIYSKTMLNLLHKYCLPSEIAKKQVRAIDRLLHAFGGNIKSITAKKMIEMAKASVGNGDEIDKISVKHLIESIWEIEKRLKNIEQTLDTKTEEIFQEEKEILTSVNGIGTYLAMSFLLETNNIRDFGNWKQLCAYAGLDPGRKESGTSLKSNGKITKKGNKRLRYILYLMAKGVSKSCPRYKAYYEKKKREGKCYFDILTAISNKLIKLLFYLLKTGKKYMDNYEQSLKLERVI